ncbi:MAG: aminodeoxychorismate/anthranilate synthase component II [Phycisphaerae bacterium]
MLLLIDNYDSFTYNLVQAIQALEPTLEVVVRRNDDVEFEQIERDKPTHIVISPGPCTPLESGLSNHVIRRFAGQIPLLGVCLGHQCIGHVFGTRVVRARRLVHGKTSLVCHDERGLFARLPNPFPAMRYHSLALDRASLPPEFEISAWCDDEDEVMAIRHREWPLDGVQFHPESFMTPDGPSLLANFVRSGYKR